LAERLVAGQRHYGMAMARRRDLPLRIQALLDASLPRGRAGRRCIALTVLLTASVILGVAPLGARTEVRTEALERDARASSILTTQAVRPGLEVISMTRVPVPRVAAQAAPAPSPAQQAARPPTPVPPAAQQAAPQLSPAAPETDGRLIVLLFDVATRQPDHVRTAMAAAVQLVNETMTNADSVAVMTNGTRLRVVQDFTSSREELRVALESPGLLSETAPDVAALAGNPIGQIADAATASDASLRALTTVCGMLGPFERRKTLLFFSTGMNLGAGVAELRAATSACHRANVSFYPVDVRGLQFRVTAVF
jgi:hypothetical protein